MDDPTGVHLPHDVQDLDGEKQQQGLRHDCLGPVVGVDGVQQRQLVVLHDQAAAVREDVHFVGIHDRCPLPTTERNG